MSHGRDDVDGEADQESTDGGVDGTEEGEDDGQEPDGDDHRQPGQSPQAYTLGVVHPYHLLPHEIQRRTCEPKRYELVNEHQDNGSVTPTRSGKQRQCIRVVQ
uniref:Uncharacterized protein n=1 Tax=Nelumbo nucifera TaxID=4432 RepID=A0A822Y3F7_NELNU|nr:TPA_asm: hypothetical protein HUJ06_029922 [Nelumbo nucifera]